MNVVIVALAFVIGAVSRWLIAAMLWPIVGPWFMTPAPMPTVAGIWVWALGGAAWNLIETAACDSRYVRSQR